MRVFGIELSNWRRGLLVAGLVLLAALPFLLDDFEVFQLTQVAVYAVAILGLNLLTGFNGQFSLGHSAFYAIGAYTAAIMMERYGIAYYWTLPAAGALSFAAGFLFGFPALRLEGLYLALATFALAVATPQLLKFSAFEGLTGGTQGIVLLKPEPPLGVPLSEDQWLYCITVLTMLLLFWVARNLVRSRVGRAMMAIRDNPIAASAMGVNITYYKTLTFGISALYTGVAGALGAIAIGFVAPDSFTFLLAVSFLVGLVVGGLGSIPGCVFGGLFVLFVPNIAENLAGELSKGLSWAVYGVILILVIYLMPAGLAGLVGLLVSRLASRK